jgi:hypothetical protein
MDDVEIKEKSTEQNGEMEEQDYMKRLKNMKNQLEEAKNNLEKLKEKIDTEADRLEMQKSELLKEIERDGKNIDRLLQPAPLEDVEISELLKKIEKKGELTDRLSQLPPLEDIYKPHVKCYSSGGNSKGDIDYYHNRHIYPVHRVSVGLAIADFIFRLGVIAAIIYGVVKFAIWILK